MDKVNELKMGGPPECELDIELTIHNKKKPAFETKQRALNLGHHLTCPWRVTSIWLFTNSDFLAQELIFSILIILILQIFTNPNTVHD